MYDKPLIVVALESEYKNPEVDILYTGVGKVNALVSLANNIEKFGPPSLIINYGTAGTVNKKHKGLVEVDVILQRDMIAEPQAPRGVTPFDKDEVAGAMMLNSNTDVTLGTGDSFVQEPDPWFEYASVDIVDMEAYALAKFAKIKKIPFRCFKYVTDFADENAMENWTKNVSDGQDSFNEKLHDIMN
tara:strand:+ start:440 stop:1000 length:561 start_codon:yes stop_codon:yes gene_type:complete